MTRSPIFPKEGSELVYDTQLEFLKFLEEARKHACNENPASQSSELVGQKVAVEDTKMKKSWKNPLLWFEPAAKNKRAQHRAHDLRTTSSQAPASSKKRGQAFGNGGRFARIHRSIRRSTSGPLSGCFTPSTAEEAEVPYARLDRQNHLSSVQSFGPIYLVT